jgi:transposase
LVFLDESGAKTNMTRLYGRSQKGQRCYDKAPDGRWKTVTMLSSIRLDGETESILFEGSVDGAMFEAYIEHILGPNLRPGDIVVLDNLSEHKDKHLIELYDSLGMKLLFLPAYSPDLNPIEKMWSKIKSILRESATETPDGLFEAIQKAFTHVTPENAQGWFESCGYFQI